MTKEDKPWPTSFSVAPSVIKHISVFTPLELTVKVSTLTADQRKP